MGRPASYDKQQLLGQVLDLFWQHGLTATPVSLLVKRTGVHAASLYSAFGSKQGLMLAALEQYAERSGKQMQQRLDAGLDSGVSARARLQHMFEGIVEDSLSDHAGRGCFLVNVAMETANSEENQQIYLKAQHYLAVARGRFQSVLQQGQQNGEINPQINCEEAAAFLQSVLFGIRVMARTRVSREMLQTSIDHGLQSIFGKYH